MTVTLVFAVLFAAPRALGEMTVPHWALLWIATLHQIALAGTLATMVWLVTGKHKTVACICAVLITLLWAPNLAAATEIAIRGKADASIRLADAIGVTLYLNDFYSVTYDLVGYQLKVAPSS